MNSTVSVEQKSTLFTGFCRIATVIIDINTAPLSHPICLLTVTTNSSDQRLERHIAVFCYPIAFNATDGGVPIGRSP